MAAWSSVMGSGLGTVNTGWNVGGGNTSSGFNLGTYFKNTGGSSGWGELLGGAAKGFFGGGSSGGAGGAQAGGSSSGIYGDLFKGVLSGLGASADAKGQLEMAREVTKIKGLEDRKTTAFEAELLDFYEQRKNKRKHRSLDMYSQFSRVSQFAPSFQRTYTGPADPGQPPQPKA